MRSRLSHYEPPKLGWLALQCQKFLLSDWERFRWLEGSPSWLRNIAKKHWGIFLVNMGPITTPEYGHTLTTFEKSMGEWWVVRKWIPHVPAPPILVSDDWKRIKRLDMAKVNEQAFNDRMFSEAIMREVARTCGLPVRLIKPKD